MKIHKTVNPVAYENTYYLEGEQHLIVVDPGSHWEAIRKTIETINKPVCAILLTHTHYDHIMSLDLVRDTYGNPPVYVAESEASWLYTPVDNLSGLPRHDDMADVICKPAEHTYVFHEEYQIEEFRFTVSTNARPLHRWSFIGFPRWTLGLNGRCPFPGNHWSDRFANW